MPHPSAYKMYIFSFIIDAFINLQQLNRISLRSISLVWNLQIKKMEYGVKLLASENQVIQPGAQFMLSYPEFDIFALIMPH